MVSLNRVLMAGNLTHDPELRHTPQGTAVATLRLAVNTPYRGKDTQNKQETCFINVVVWEKTAEACKQYLQKGRGVIVEGRLQSRSWQDENGKNRITYEIKATQVQFLGGNPEKKTEVLTDVPVNDPEETIDDIKLDTEIFDEIN